MKTKGDYVIGKGPRQSGLHGWPELFRRRRRRRRRLGAYADDPGF